MNNVELYESREVLDKYGANATRVRTLNNAEKIFIDRFGIKDKNVLVVGCGSGRVAANLLLFGNTVTGVDRSQGMIQQARKNFPSEHFPKLRFLQGDASDLSFLKDEFFDAVFFPQNGIDYIDSVPQREKALVEMAGRLRSGGLLAFTSNNKIAHFFSYKLFCRHTFLKPFQRYVFSKGHVVGGGTTFKGTPSYIISRTQALSDMTFIGFVCEVRNRLDSFFSKRLFFAQFVFPHLLYVFRKK